MLRKIKEIDPKEFAEAEDIQKITIKGQMRKLYEEINRKLAVGWSAKDLVDLLDRQGLSMSVELFRVYLRDIDAEQGYKRSIRQFSSKRNSQTVIAVASSESTKVLVPVPNSLAQITTYSNNLKKEQFKTITEDLIRPEGITDATWKDMKVQHLTNMRRN